jgi:transposase-like protein
MNAVRRSKREQWAAVAAQSLHTARQNVSCPECGVAALQIRDVEYGGGQRRGLDRYLLCSHCGCFRTVNLRRAGIPAEAYLIAAE